MCEPLTFISAALGAAQAGYAYRGQQYQQGIALRNKRIAKESEEKRVANEMTATNLRQIQEGIADAQLIQENDTYVFPHKISPIETSQLCLHN